MDKKLKHIVLGIIFSIIIALVYGIPAALIPNPFILYYRMIAVTAFDYIFLILISISLGAYLSYFLYNKSLVKQKEDTKVFGGALLGILAIGCPICNVFLMSVFGSALLLGFFEPIRPLVGIASVGLIGASIYFMKNRSCEECSVPKK